MVMGLEAQIFQPGKISVVDSIFPYMQDFVFVAIFKMSYLFNICGEETYFTDVECFFKLNFLYSYSENLLVVGGSSQ